MVVLHWPKLFGGLVCPAGDAEINGWGLGYGYSFSGGGEGGGNYHRRGSGWGNGQLIGNGWGCSEGGGSDGNGENPQPWN